MHVQVLSSGSEGNSTLVRCGELTLLVDAGLSMRALTERLEAARTRARMRRDAEVESMREAESGDY